MSNQEILEKVFKKVGYDSLSVYFLSTYYSNDLCPIIFHHDFAKAFWGDKIKEGHCFINNQYVDQVETWKWHLQQMVLEPEPLKYLEKFL